MKIKCDYCGNIIEMAYIELCIPVYIKIEKNALDKPCIVIDDNTFSNNRHPEIFCPKCEADLQGITIIDQRTSAEAL